jgi:hypothetical protein
MPERSLTSPEGLVTVGAHAGCQGVVAALSAPLAHCGRVFDLGASPGGQGAEGRSSQVAADRSLQLLSPCRSVGGCQRARGRLSQPPSSLFPGDATLLAPGLDSPLEVSPRLVTMAERHGLGRHHCRYGIARPHGQALALAEDPALHALIRLE